MLPGELFPTAWKATGHGISAASGKAGAIVGAFGFLYASQPRDREKAHPYPPGIGLRESLAVLAAINFVGMMFTFLIPETKGRTLEEINGEWSDLPLHLVAKAKRASMLPGTSGNNGSAAAVTEPVGEMVQESQLQAHSPVEGAAGGAPVTASV